MWDNLIIWSRWAGWGSGWRGGGWGGCSNPDPSNLAAVAGPGSDADPVWFTGQAGEVPPSDGDLTTPRGLTLPAAAIDERFARGSGPGGQHRNVTASAVELVADLNALDGPEARRVRSVLGELVSDPDRCDSRSVSGGNRSYRPRTPGPRLIDNAADPVTPCAARPDSSRRARQLDDSTTKAATSRPPTSATGHLAPGRRRLNRPSITRSRPRGGTAAPGPTGARVAPCGLRRRTVAVRLRAFL